MKCVLSKVYVGHSQDMRQFNIVEGGHSVIGVCNIFGSFIRFQVTEDRDDGECWVIEHARDSNGIHNFPPSVTEKTIRYAIQCYCTVFALKTITLGRILLLMENHL